MRNYVLGFLMLMYLLEKLSLQNSISSYLQLQKQQLFYQ